MEIRGGRMAGTRLDLGRFSKKVLPIPKWAASVVADLQLGRAFKRINTRFTEK
jgi:hypothetical protein